MSDDGCGEQDSGIPDCMVKIDLLPDAELPHLGHAAFLKADQVIHLRISASDLKRIYAFNVGFERCLELPDSLDWYVKQQRLLI